MRSAAAADWPSTHPSSRSFEALTGRDRSSLGERLHHEQACSAEQEEARYRNLGPYFAAEKGAKTSPGNTERSVFKVPWLACPDCLSSAANRFSAQLAHGQGLRRSRELDTLEPKGASELPPFALAQTDRGRGRETRQTAEEEWSLLVFEDVRSGLQEDRVGTKNTLPLASSRLVPHNKESAKTLGCLLLC